MLASELINFIQWFIDDYGDHEIRINGDVNETDIKMHVFYNEFFCLSNSDEPI